MTAEPHPLQDFQGYSLEGVEAFKPGRKATHEIGVGYYAPWEEPFDGFAEHSRRSVRALARTGVPVQLRSIDPGGQLQAGKERIRVAMQMEPLLINEVSQYAVQVYQLVPSAARLHNILHHAQRDPEQQEVINRHTVLYTVWERSRVSGQMASLLNLAGQVWVACEANRDMLIEAGVDAERVKRVPVPFYTDDPLLALSAQERHPGPPRFYNIGKWEPRKQQHRVLGAFLRAFRPGEARLLLKTSSQAPKFDGYPRSPEHSIHEWIGDEAVKQNGWRLETMGRFVHVIKQALPQTQILSLHRTGDVYVSLSQGEGWDMPAFDAKLAGNMLVYTPSGGPQDFAGEADWCVPARGEVACHPFYGWEQEARYLDYDLDDAVTGLRRAAAAMHRGWGRDAFEFRASVVGGVMRELLEGLLGDRLPSSYEKVTAP